jgi:general L-amino acid transport system permease protein
VNQQASQAHARPPLWRNAAFLKWAGQIAVLAALIVGAIAAVSVASQNLKDQGLPFSWAFLNNNPGIQLSEGLTTAPQSSLEALLVGIVNMLRVTFTGIVAATALGVIVGIARLSSNWIVSKVAVVYIELVRNVPLLVQIVFWLSVSIGFPDLKAQGSGPIEGWFYITNKGISVPWFFPREVFWQWVAFVVVGLIASRWVFHRRVRHVEETGEAGHEFVYAIGTLLLFAVAGWWLNPITGFLGWIFDAIGWVFRSSPVLLGQVVLAVASVTIGGLWIKRFLDSRRTPAGLAKLTDDDYFRLIFAGVVGVAAAAVFIVVPGITGGILEGLQKFFEFAASKFVWLRSGQVAEFGRPGVVVPGKFPQFAPTGMTMTPSFFALWIGVTLYTAGFIAEIVRGGILAVPKGQTEAGLAVGLRRSQVLRMIVLPQAFRVIVPPMGNQYLNLAKNTSLGIAVAYAELVAVGSTIINQTGATIQVILFWMGYYLIVSLLISALVNWYNRRVQLVER